VFLLNPPSHDAKSGCKGTKKSEKRKVKSEKNACATTILSFFLVFSVQILTFAADKSIKIAI